MHFVRLATTLLKVEESARHNPPFRLSPCQIFTDFLYFFHCTDRLSNKPCIIWLLKIPPHLKYVPTVPCNLSLITALVCDCRSFSDISVSQGSVAMHTRCGGTFNKYFTANLLENLTAKNFLKSAEN